MARPVVYTALFGPCGDELRPAMPDPLVDYVAFVDTSHPALSSGAYRGWRLQEPPAILPDPRRQSRFPKLLPHRLFPDVPWSLWLDASLELKVQPSSLLSHLPEDGPPGVCLFRHRYRQCLYEEARVCLEKELDDPEVINCQVSGYRNSGYPPGRGLQECGLLLRMHTPEIVQLGEAWWAEVKGGSLRDQLSFGYVCWRLNVVPVLFPGTVANNEYVRWRAHRRTIPATRR